MQTDIKVGETVILDEKFINTSRVKVIHLTINKLFAEVISEGELNEKNSWSVMTYRLSKIKVS